MHFRNFRKLLNGVWLRYNRFVDLEEDVLAEEIVEDLEATLKQFREIAA